MFSLLTNVQYLTVITTTTCHNDYYMKLYCEEQCIYFLPCELT